MATPLQYIKTLDEPRKSQISELFSVIKKELPKLKPYMMETTHGNIICFGKDAYETKSGCKGEWFTVGLANRKQGIAIYVCSAKNGKYLAETYKKDFAKAKCGRSCITVKNLDGFNVAAFKKMIKEAGEIGMCFG